MEKNFVKVGYINVTEDEYVVIADPGYNLDSRWIDIVEVKQGMYDCYIEEQNCGEWGTRVSRLAILKDSYGVDKLDNKGVSSTKVAVDSGTMGIYAYHYFNEINEDDSKKDIWYDKMVCGNWDKYRLCGENGIFASSGYGDGLYEVYYYYDDAENVIGIEVVFIESDDNE